MAKYSFLSYNKDMNRTKEEIINLRKEIKEKTVGYILAAFGFVAGLAWNEAIKSAISRYFPAGSGIVSLIIYAVVVTIIAVLVTAKLNKIAEKYKTKDEDA